MQKSNNPIKELPTWDKPREKLLAKGAACLSDKELLSILIASGTAEHSALDLAGLLLGKDLNSLSDLSNYEPEEFMKLKGIGKAKACHLAAALELGRRIANCQAIDRLDVRSPQSLAQVFQNDMQYQMRETVQIAMIDVKSHLIGKAEISIGGIANSSAHPREVFAPAIRKGAAAIVLAHNHPSGDCTPSLGDVEVTRIILDSGKVLGIQLLDHIIIGRGDRYYSFLEHEPQMFKK